MKHRLRQLVDSMHVASNSDEAVKLLRASGDILGMRLPCALEDVSGNTAVCDSQGRRIADLLGWPAWITDNWFDHGYVRQHPNYLRCRFERMPFGGAARNYWATALAWIWREPRWISTVMTGWLFMRQQPACAIHASGVTGQ